LKGVNDVWLQTEPYYQTSFALRAERGRVRAFEA